MLHHSNSRNQRNRGSRIKTLLQATLLLGVLVWLLYQVKHSYARKNEYLDDTEDHLARNDRSMFQGRKEKAGSYSDSNVEMVRENSDVITKPEEGAVDNHSDTFDHNDVKSGETVFEKNSIDLHEDDKRNTERSEAEGQANGADGNTEAHHNNNDSEANNRDAESNSDAEGKSEVHSTEEDMPQNNAREENTGETNGNDEIVQGNESTHIDQTNASGNGSDGEEGEKKEVVDTQTGSESLPEDAKAETTDGHATGGLPDETGNVPSVLTENSQNDASENKGDAASTTSDSSDHSTSEAVHVETGLEDEGATASSSGTASGDEKGNPVESNQSDSASAEEKTETASGGDVKGAETGTANEVSDSKEANSEKGTSATEVTNDQAANTEAENSQGDSAGEVVNGSSEETKPMENQSGGATETSNNGEQVDVKIETGTSSTDQHNESQGSNGTSGSNNPNGNSNDSGPEQTSKAESQ